jgi:hypothetical protein
MKQHIFEVWILVMAMRAPALAAQIDLHVAGARRIIADLDQRAVKIRAAFYADKAGMENADRPSVIRFKPVAPQPLMLPNGLEEPFRGEIFIAQKVFSAALCPPGGIEIFQSHEALLLAFCGRKVKAEPRLGNFSTSVSAEGYGGTGWGDKEREV